MQFPEPQIDDTRRHVTLAAYASLVFSLPQAAVAIALQADSTSPGHWVITLLLLRQALLLGFTLLLLRQAAAWAPGRQALSFVAWQVLLTRNELTPMQLGQDVEVRANNKGQGLYALREMEPGELIDRYRGVMRKQEQAATLGIDEDYGIGLPGGYEISAVDPKRSNFVRYINHSVLKANCGAYSMWSETDPVSAIYLRTTRRILPGEELVFDYGESYWDARVPRFSPKRLLIDYVF